MLPEDFSGIPNTTPKYRRILGEVVGGRSEEIMRADLAAALHECTGLSVERAADLLSTIAPSRVTKEGGRTRPATEIMAIIEVAIRLFKESGEKREWPRYPELSRATGMTQADLERIARAKLFPQELRPIIIRTDSRYLRKSK